MDELTPMFLTVRPYADVFQLGQRLAVAFGVGRAQRVVEVLLGTALAQHLHKVRVHQACKNTARVNE